jgi:hypothetical protein
MSLVLPDPNSELGPAWATLLNAALTLVDGHDHSSGKGPRITPAAFNVNADFTFNNWSLTSLKMTSAMTDNTVDPTGSSNRCLFFLNGEFYAKDGSGNNVQITNSGSVAGATGNIGGIIGSAAITYTSIGVNRFVFTDEAGVLASIEAEDIECDTVNATTVNASNGQGVVPVGAIIPIASHLTGSISIPSTGTVDANGFMLCDGAAIPGGQTLSGNTPNLTDDRFLMGDTTGAAGGTGGNTTININHTHSVNSHTHSSGSYVTRIDANSSTLYWLDTAGGFTANTQATGLTSYGGSSTSRGRSAVVAGISGSSSPGTSGALSSAQDIRPKYLSVVYLIRVS